MRLTRLATAVVTSLALTTSSALLIVDQAAADTPTPSPDARTAAPAPASVVAKPGDSGETVSDVQRMLFFIGAIRLNERTGTFDAATSAGVKAFQRANGLSDTGIVDSATYTKLQSAFAARTTPTVQKKTVQRKVVSPIPKPAAKPAPKPAPATSDVVKYGLDSRCDDEAKVICADQSRRKVWYLENGKVVKTFDARFGASSTPTRNGKWRIFSKVKNEWSYLYNVRMPYSMYFSGGEAFHYSADFAQIGWNNSRGGSHGCVNIRDYKGIAWVFNRVPVGTLAIVTA